LAFQTQQQKKRKALQLENPIKPLYIADQPIKKQKLVKTEQPLAFLVPTKVVKHPSNVYYRGLKKTAWKKKAKRCPK